MSLDSVHADKTQNILALSGELIERAGSAQGLEEAELNRLYETRDFLVQWAMSRGLSIVEMKEDENNPFPFLILTFPQHVQGDRISADIALLGHVDVVKPVTDDQRVPRIEDEMLVGRGSADMLTVMATYFEWMAAHANDEMPPSAMVLVSFTEETGSIRGNSSREGLKYLEEMGSMPKFIICGERTGEMGTIDDVEVPVHICERNIGLRQFDLDWDPAGELSALDALVSLGNEISAIRNQVAAANEEMSSDTMAMQTTWRSNIASTYGEITDNTGGSGDERSLYLRFEISDQGHVHSARRDVNEPHSIEHVIPLLNVLQSFQLGVKLIRAKWGDVSKINTASTGFKMDLELTAHGSISFNDICDDAMETVRVPFGITPLDAIDFPTERKAMSHFDARIIPEHEALFGNMINDLQVDGSHVHETSRMPAWNAPSNSVHVQALGRAVKDVTGKDPVFSGKTFCNDACFALRDGTELDAVIYGQRGFGPHQAIEAHHIPSIGQGYVVLERFFELLETDLGDSD